MEMYWAGVIFGVVVTGFIGSIAGLEAPTSWWDFAKDWGTTVGVYLALLTYIGTLFAGWLRSKRRREAALASLGVDLSEFCEYADQCMHLAYLLYKAVKAEEDLMLFDHAAGLSTLEYKRMEDNKAGTRKALEDRYRSEGGVPWPMEKSLERVARAAGELGDRRLSDILNTYQVQRARLSENLERFLDPLPAENFTFIQTAHHMFGLIEDAARLYRLASQAFDLPRRGWDFYSTDVGDEDIKNTIINRHGIERDTNGREAS